MMAAGVSLVSAEKNIEIKCILAFLTNIIVLMSIVWCDWGLDVDVDKDKNFLQGEAVS